MVNELKWRNDYPKENFTKLFGEHYYKSYGDSDKDIKELRAAGKSIVPDFMSGIGCPAAATLIDKTAQIKSNQRVYLASQDMISTKPQKMAL